MLRRMSIIGWTANLAAVGLICLTGAALATPSLPAEFTGLISGLPSLDLTGAYIDTLTPVFVSSVATFYRVYATLTSFVSVSSGGSSFAHLIDVGNVLISAVDAIPGVSSSVVSFLQIIDIPSSLGDSSATFRVIGSDNIPEPNTIALVVTGIAGLATVLRRRKLHRGG
jgi:hypothetical protein